MNTTQHVKHPPASYLFRRHICAGPIPQPPSPAQEESKITQTIQHLIETPNQEWSTSPSLQSIFSSSTPPSSLFIFKITRDLPSYCQGFNFFKHIQQRLPFEDTNFLSYPLQELLEQAGRELDPLARLSELYQASKEWEIPLTINAAAILIRSFANLETIDKSVSVYNELDPCLKTTHVRNVLIYVLLKSGRVECALNVLDEMLQPTYEFRPNDITRDIVFNALVKRNRKGVIFIKKQIKLVFQFGERGFFPNTNWLTPLICKLCRSGKINQAWNVLNELLRIRAPLQAPPFNALLTGLARHGDVSGMNRVLADMMKSDIKPDVATLGIVIKQLCKLRKVDEAMEVFNTIGEESGSDGLLIEADVVIYNTLVDGLCKVGRVEEGLRLMERMKSTNGLAPNRITYTCLIDGYCKAGEIERGKELFDQMNEEGVLPNVVTLNALVDGMCRHGRIDSAIEFFNDMQGKGLKGNVVTYTTLITVSCDVDDLDMAVDLLDQMLRSGVTADATVYCNLFHGFCKAGRMDDANNVLSKFKQAGFRPDIVCYNALLIGFCKKNKIDKACEIVKEMEEVGMKPDSVTYNTLIAYLCKNGDLALALRVIKQMTKDGLVPTIETYGVLIHAYCLNGKTKEAMKLFTDTNSIPPNTVIYNILIESLCKNNEVEVALSLMEDMKAKGAKPDTTTYNAMFKGLKEKNLLEDGLILMDSMTEHACEPNYITMEILTEWLSAVGELERLISFIQGNKVSKTTA